MRKINLITIDCESSIDDKAVDIAAVISDRKGNIINQMAVLVHGIYDNRTEHPLFHKEGIGTLWSQNNLDKRYIAYDRMLDSGARMLASVGAINNWLMIAKAQYNPVLTAYNLPFDVAICRNTGINLESFDKRFCLWSACVTAYAKTRKYRQFIVDNHLFLPATKHGNMSYPTNAEVMTRFVLGDISIPNEPHLSLEDILGYEKPMLDKLLKAKSVKWLLENTRPYNWRNFQVKDHFKPR